MFAGQDNVSKSGEVTLVLEDAWSTVGASQVAPHRGELIVLLFVNVKPGEMCLRVRD